ncbi:MAG: hypothetical protein SFY81_08070 [Verrucomicrobiota bacterium]|nr:hypothetical protein [Verrucomicrobiota bacterium]
MMKLGKDLYDRLEGKQRDMISSQPISIETEMTPFVRLLYYPDEPKAIRGVWVSAGFIDLVNHVAHAKAIDIKEKGYFNKYIQILAKESGERELQPLPNDQNPKYWTDEMLNEQLSNFNSIVGIVVGIKLAHHYLGHYDKYKERLTDAKGNVTPINNVITEKEWDEAFEQGVRNALGAGCFTEGVIPFFEAFDKMEQRPAWVAYFLPPHAKFAKLKKRMEKIQSDYLAGN